MPRKSTNPLRAVRPGEYPVRKRKLTLTEAASSGTTLELLEAMRDRIALAVTDPNCPAPALAALTRRLHEIVKDIAAIRLAGVDGDGPADTPDEPFGPDAL